MSTYLFSEDDVEENPSSSASSSRMELKRIHQWLTQENSSGSELFSNNNKRQVVEIDGGSRPRFSTPAWDNSLVPNCLFDPATSHLLGRYISPLDHQEELLHGTSSFNRKVTATNQVCESRNMPPESMVQFYGEGVSRSFETVPYYEASTLSLGQTFSTIDKSFISPEPFASHPDGNFIPNSSYGQGDENVFSTFHPFDKGVGNFAQSLQKAADDENVFMSLLPRHMIESSHHKDNVNAVLSGRQSPFSQGGEMAAFTVPSQEKADKNSDHQISHEDTTISPVPVVNSFENFFSHSPADDYNMSFQPRYPPYASSALLVHKSKDSKTAKKGSSSTSTNTFPSNVKSLLSTGMFDGVTVKYYSWSREVSFPSLLFHVTCS